MSISAESFEPNAPAGKVNRNCSGAPLKPVRILVVEDFPVNRLLVQVYLRGRGHELVFAEDGKTALDRYLPGEFDLVLMDLRLPVMDGLSATRQIRKMERELGALATPIIALTACARAQDIEASSQAGCNDHLAKPISKHKLLAIVEEYAMGRKESKATPAGPTPWVRVAAPAGLENLVPGYLAARRKEAADMLQMLEASDFERLARLGHNMKATGTPYGFPELTRLGGSVERASRQADKERLSTDLLWLRDYLGRVQLIEPEFRPPAQ